MMHRRDLSRITIGDDVLDCVPESVVRDLVILPLACRENCLHVVLPADADIAGTVGKLEFLLNVKVTCDTAEREAIQETINRYYPTGREDRWEDDLPPTLPELDYQADYPLLDLVGQIHFDTPGSLSFHLGHKRDTLDIPEDKQRYIGPGRVFQIVGWLDVHYPASGECKLRVRCSLPSEYCNLSTMQDLGNQLRDLLSLPRQISCEVHLQATGEAVILTNDPYHFT